MISLLFAVPHESALVRASLSDRDSFRISSLTCIVGAYAGEQISIGFLGMGGESASRQTSLFLRYFRPRFIILAGYAGALTPEVIKGEVVLASNYSQSSSLKLPAGIRNGPITTVTQVIGTRKDREDLHRSTGALMVDMETAPAAEIISQTGVPLLVLRGISDGLEDELPTKTLAAAYDPKRQVPTPVRLVLHLLGNPGEIAPFARFVTGLSPVRKALSKVILETISLNRLLTEE